MPIQRHTLRAFPTVAACCDAIDLLHKQFRKTHQRNATVSLCYSLTSAPDPTVDAPFYMRDIHLVSIHADLPAQAAELAWFTQAIATL